jgi:molybdopterin converting factor small subunit
MMATTLTVRYFAGARAAAGLAEERVEVGPGQTLTDLVRDLADRHGPELGRVLTASSFLVDEVSAGGDRALAGAGTIDVLPPFAGG